MNRKILVVMVGLVLASLIFSSISVASKKEITIWVSQSRDPAMNEAMKQYWKDFEQIRPGVKVNGVVMREEDFYQKLPAAIEGNAPPDISWMVAPMLQPYISAGLIMDVSSLYEEITSRGGGIIESPAKRSTSRNGKYWGIPLSYSPIPLYSRKDLLAEVGLEVPRTLDELVQAAQKVNNPPDVYGFAQSFGGLESDSECLYYPVMWNFGGSYVAEDGVTVVFDSPENSKAFDWIRYIYEDTNILPPGVVSWGGSDNNKLYQAGKTALTVNSLSVYGWLLKNDPELLEKTEIGPWVAGPAGAFTSGTCEVLSIFKNTKEPLLAKNLLSFLFDPLRYGNLMEASSGYAMPIFNDLRKLPFWTAGAIGGAAKAVPSIREMGTGYPGPVTAAAGMVWSRGVLPDVVHKIVLEKWTVDKALAWGQEEIEKIYAEFPPEL